MESHMIKSGQVLLWGRVRLGWFGNDKGQELEYFWRVLMGKDHPKNLTLDGITEECGS